MNELRWIILGIGILIIVAIYLWESWKQKRQLRERVDSFTGPGSDSYTNLRISPRKEKHGEKELDLSAAADAFNSYLKKSRNSTDTEEIPETAGENAGEPAGPDDTGMEEENRQAGAVQGETIIVIYIVAAAGSVFSGSDIQNALQEADLHFGDMQIFHYRGQGDEFRQRALFSVANIHEPGTFDIDHMASMETDGLAIFMCLPAPIGGDIAFEIMLDTARVLASRLDGELRNEKHAVLDVDVVNRLRQTASQY